MERVLSLIRRQDLETDALKYWAGRTPEERIGEVDRLRREYRSAILGKRGKPERLRRTLRVIECPWR